MGAEITISTLIGNVSLKIAPNTKNGQKIRLSGCGIKQNDNPNEAYTLTYLDNKGRLVKTTKEIDLYKKLQELRGGKRVF